MRIFKRRRSRRVPAALDLGEKLGAAAPGVPLAPVGDGGSTVARPTPRAQLLRIVAEAVVLQDKAAELLVDIRNREPLGEVAPRGGPLMRRFFQLRGQLPRPANREMARQCETVSVVLDHHGMLIASALELLAVDWRSPAVVEQLELLDGLGAPAERLDAVYAELAH